MPLTIRLVDPVTSIQRVYVIRDFEEVTLADWKRMNSFQSAGMNFGAKLDSAYNVVSEFTGLPVSLLDTRPMKEVSLVLDKIGDEFVLALKGTENFQKTMQSGLPYTPITQIHIDGRQQMIPSMSEELFSRVAWLAWGQLPLPIDESTFIAEGVATILGAAGCPGYLPLTDKAISHAMGVRMAEALEVCSLAFASSEPFRKNIASRGRRFPVAVNAVVAMSARIAPGETATFGRYAIL